MLTGRNTEREVSAYGAAELKNEIPVNAFKSFLMTLGTLAAGVMLFYLTNDPIKDFPNPFGERNDLPGPTVINIYEFENETPELLGKATNEPVVKFVTEFIAGNPLPTSEVTINEDFGEFATIDKLAYSSSIGGVDMSYDELRSNAPVANDDNSVNITQKESEPDPFIFNPIEKSPATDMQGLSRLIEYPVLARQAGIEGKVILRVLIGKSGEPLKAMVMNTESALLNQAAIDAVMKAAFTPGIQNGNPVKVWVTIPVNFKLK